MAEIFNAGDDKLDAFLKEQDKKVEEFDKNAGGGEAGVEDDGKGKSDGNDLGNQVAAPGEVSGGEGGQQAQGAASAGDSGAFDIKTFNEKFESDFESEDRLRSSLKDLSVLDTTKQELERSITDLQVRYNELKEVANPRKHFVNDIEYKRQLMLQKYGNEINPDVLSRIISTDLGKASDVDVLVLGKLLNTPDIEGGERGARELVLNGLGIEGEDPGEWDALTRNKIKDTAASVRRSLSKLTDIEVPVFDDPDKSRDVKRQEQTQKLELSKIAWNGAIDKALPDMNKFDVYDNVDGKKEVIFSYDVDQEFKDSVKQEVLDYVVNQGMEPNGENLEKAIQFVEQKFITRKFTDMMQAAIKDVETKTSERLKKQYENPGSSSDKTREVNKDKDLAELRSYLRGGIDAPKEGEKLF